jgi:hypothetical protein
MPLENGLPRQDQRLSLMKKGYESAPCGGRTGTRRDLLIGVRTGHVRIAAVYSLSIATRSPNYLIGRRLRVEILLTQPLPHIFGISSDNPE